ncbi:MAG: response regulator [Desulfatiglans sp.]|jgi:DNA-binding response OmpR family regulator|nr:response regulator [Thermodesulfobacteriota bacterium]MEE4353110.1 response regulator [Desulfatiglans sp.]
MRILLVDDEEELVSTLAERLAIRGINADWVTSGDAALKMVESQHYDLAVLDIKIPIISGVSLKKKIQAKRPGMKFIFMTGHGSEDDFMAGSKETGPEFYLVKPVDIKTLIEKINMALNRRRDTL